MERLAKTKPEPRKQKYASAKEELMKIAFTIMAVVAAALTATSAAHAQAACPSGKVAVAHARGGTVCIVPSKTFGECVANSLRNGFPEGQSRSVCRKRYPQ